MELTHQDLVEAFDRVCQQLEVIEDSVIYRDLNKSMFDIEEVLKVLGNLKSRVVLDAHKKGILEWK